MNLPRHFTTTYKQLMCSLVSLFIFTISTLASADILDPVEYIKKNGYQVKKGEDGKPTFFSATEKASSSRINSLLRKISKLPKDESTQKVCTMLQENIKHILEQTRKGSFNVSIENYGQQDSKTACAIKYTQADIFGRRLIYSGNDSDNVYMVIIANEKK